MLCIIIFYGEDGKLLSYTYLDNFTFRDMEAEVKLFAPKNAVRVVFDIALQANNNGG